MAETVTTLWTRTDHDLPPEGVPVKTLSEGGQEQTLIRKGRLWFLPDMSMYVYYTPAYWRHSSPPPRRCRRS